MICKIWQCLLVLSLCRMDLLMREMRWISPSSLTARREMPLGARSAVV